MSNSTAPSINNQEWMRLRGGEIDRKRLQLRYRLRGRSSRWEDYRRSGGNVTQAACQPVISSNLCQEEDSQKAHFMVQA
uniref:Uncharacterized protein n=1 Tax=Mastacembelus armatus TaxID=205130 RepID=A0A3Q3MZW6_9TELE